MCKHIRKNIGTRINVHLDNGSPKKSKIFLYVSSMCILNHDGDTDKRIG